MRYAYFIGGPLDGQRRSIDALHTQFMEAVVRQTFAPSTGQPNFQVSRVVYRAYSSPVNPARMAYGAHGVDPSIIDADIVIYHYAGIDPTSSHRTP